MSTLMNFLLLKWMNVQYRVQEPGGRRMDFETDQITFYVFDIKNGQYFVQVKKKQQTYCATKQTNKSYG